MVRIDIAISALQPLPSGQVVLVIEVNGKIEGCPDACVDWSATVLADSREDALAIIHPLQVELARLRDQGVEIEGDA